MGKCNLCSIDYAHFNTGYYESALSKLVLLATIALQNPDDFVFGSFVVGHLSFVLG